MIKENVIIINFDILYAVLDEIKENLSFNISSYKTGLEFINNSEVEEKNSLIIIQSNKDFFLNNNIEDKNLLLFDSLPLHLNKLNELINIELIKLKFNQQSKISINNYKLNLNTKYLSTNNINLKLTEKEIEIILFLSTKKNKQTVADLQKNIWGYSDDLETHTVETHVYRLRKKISNTFNDKNFILSHQEGYFIK